MKIGRYKYEFDFFSWIKKTELVELDGVNPSDDPVRPELDNEFRTSKGRKIPDLVAELFPYLMENLERPGGVLSGGQQQQLAIARALASDPKLLLMDEPTEGIQPNIVEQIEECITRLNRELKLTIVLVEQNVDFARKAASHFAMIENGTCKVDGKIEKLTAKIVSQYMTI